jgi:hypothetical protein
VCDLGRRTVALISFKNNYNTEFNNNELTEMCSGSEEGSYSRLMDFCTTPL